tara:strand:+ start:719 stop:976 length:258 start_codon:yes stop_codon:yes gene_type:complete
MEMLNGIVVGTSVAVAVAIIGMFGWIALSVVDLKTDTAIIALKVDENHKMLTTLWEDYVDRNSSGNLAWLNETANIQPASEEKIY